jgi:hypothetical protein
MSVTIGKLGIIRLDGEDLTRLRLDCFERDHNRCSECDRRVSRYAPEWADHRAHMAHIVSRGAGGSDTLENVRTLCREHHMEDEHNPKCVREKA